MTIEQRLLKDYGTTEIPEFATWMLRDGTMINGSIEGHQRDIDHRCIGEYFKRSKFEDPGSAGIYMKKFMNRGNIRLCCDQFGYNIELRRVPSMDQLLHLSQIMRQARYAVIPRNVEWFSARGKRHYTSWEGYEQYINSYTDLRLCC